MNITCFAAAPYVGAPRRSRNLPFTGEGRMSPTSMARGPGPVPSVSRRAFASAAAALPLSFLLSPLLSRAATLLTFAETRAVLSSVGADLSDGSPWYTLEPNDLRAALRSGNASALRIAARAVPQLCRGALAADADSARDTTIRELEAADLAALRAARGQKGGADVAQHLRKMGDSVDRLLEILDQSSDLES